MPGIHHWNPAMRPSSRRMVKVSVSFNTRSARSCVVVVQTFPTIGNRTSTTWPADLSLSISATGLRKWLWLEKSTRKSGPSTCQGTPGSASPGHRFAGETITEMADVRVTPQDGLYEERRFRLMTPWPQLVSTGVLWTKVLSSICLMRKSATSAREMNPHVHRGDQLPRDSCSFS